jgi:hypothetical protein
MVILSKKSDIAIIPQAMSAPKHSVVPSLTRLISYWLTVATFVWSITIVHTWNAEQVYDAIQAQLIDPVRGLSWPTQTK